MWVCRPKASASSHLTPSDCRQGHADWFSVRQKVNQLPRPALLRYSTINICSLAEELPFQASSLMLSAFSSRTRGLCKHLPAPRTTEETINQTKRHKQSWKQVTKIKNQFQRFNSFKENGTMGLIYPDNHSFPFSLYHKCINPNLEWSDNHRQMETKVK